MIKALLVPTPFWQVADKRQRQLTTLIAVAESSRRERDVALRNAASRDAELRNLTFHLQQQESDVGYPCELGRVLEIRRDSFDLGAREATDRG